MSPRRRAAGATAAALTLATLTSCALFGSGEPELRSEPLPSPSATAEEDRAADLQRYYNQEVTWATCRKTMACTEVEVPLDYARPAGPAIRLAVLKVPATHPDRRVGALVVNPGGPGVSGVEYAARSGRSFGREVVAAYDVVGFDPRGVGSSTPVDCVDDVRLDRFVGSDPDPDTAQEAREGLRQLRELGKGCLRRSGALAAHVSTEEAARDMDVLRAVLGQETMAYFGASYGTFLGATYADLFPGRVGRMVLDGAVDPTLGTVEMSLVQARGFETALRAYVGACVERADCFLGATVDEGVGTVQRLLEQVDRQPIRGDGRRDLTEGWAVLGIWAPLYNEEYWPALDAGLAQALQGDGRTLLSFADTYVSRGPQGYLNNSAEAIYAVNCLDRDERVPLQEVARQEGSFVEASPTFGRIFAFGLTACGAWPIDSGKGPQQLTARGAAPILVIGTTRDPATPLEWAQALAGQLESGVLVRRDGDGHTGYHAGNQCVDRTVDRYLVSGEVPDRDVDC